MSGSPGEIAAEAAESVCDLRFGQVGVACVRVRRNDAPALCEELTRKVQAAPQLFARAAVLLDFSHLGSALDITAARDLIDAVGAAGMLPIGLAYGAREMEVLSEALELPLIAKFRAAYQREDGEKAEAATTKSSPRETPTSAPATAATPATLHHSQAVRSGQQVYAQGRDLAVSAPVANGAEVIADGSIHIYGPLRGRALAGALGDRDAHIYCTEFRAELVSIAGQYRVFEQLPRQLDGHATHIWLEGERLRVEPMDT